jgi:hypothetical protein
MRANQEWVSASGKNALCGIGPQRVRPAVCAEWAKSLDVASPASVAREALTLRRSYRADRNGASLRMLARSSIVRGHCSVRTDSALVYDRELDSTHMAVRERQFRA